MEERLQLRCRRCRRGVELTCSSTATGESSADVCAVWHLSVDQLPAWILTSVQQAQWTAGKLNCCSCGSRLGGFNFLNRSKCPCGMDTMVHLSKSRLDQDQKQCNLIVQPRRMRSGTETGQSEPSRISRPAGSSDGLPDGWDHRRRCCLEDDVISEDSRDLLRSESSLLKGQQFDTEAPTDLRVPGGSGAGHSTQNQDQTDEDVESTSDHEELSGSSLRRRFSCDEEALLQDEQESSEPVSSSAAIRLKKREKNRLKSRRRKERRRQRWLQVLEEEQAEKGSTPDSEAAEDRDGLTCPVCLDVYFSPYACRPCGHVFCEPCLRTLARNRLTDTPCPLCRALISNTGFDRELDQTVKTLFPRLYSGRKQNFQSASCARWPLPNAKKPFGWFREDQRAGATAWRRWHLVHGGFTPGAVYLNAQGSLTGLVLVHFSPVYWILGLKVLCVFCLLVLSFLLGF